MFDVLAHDDRKGLRGRDGGEDVLGRALGLVGKRGVEAGDHRLLDLGAAEAVRGGDQPRQVEIGLVAAAASAGGPRRSLPAPPGRANRRKRFRRTGPCASVPAATGRGCSPWRSGRSGGGGPASRTAACRTSAATARRRPSRYWPKRRPSRSRRSTTRPATSTRPAAMPRGAAPRSRRCTSDRARRGPSAAAASARPRPRLSRRLLPHPCTPSKRIPAADRARSRGPGGEAAMPHIQPSLQVAQAADVVGRDIGGDRPPDSRSSPADCAWHPRPAADRNGPSTLSSRIAPATTRAASSVVSPHNV